MLSIADHLLLQDLNRLTGALEAATRNPKPSVSQVQALPRRTRAESADSR